MGSCLLTQWPKMVLLEITEIQDSQQKLKPWEDWSSVSLLPYSVGQKKPQSSLMEWERDLGIGKTPPLDGKS